MDFEKNAKNFLRKKWEKLHKNSKKQLIFVQNYYIIAQVNFLHFSDRGSASC